MAPGRDMADASEASRVNGRELLALIEACCATGCNVAGVTKVRTVNFAYPAINAGAEQKQLSWQHPQ